MRTIPFTKPGLDESDRAAIAQALQSGSIGGNGLLSARAQDKLKEILGVKLVSLTTSCTHAMEMAAMALDIQPGDEVIMPSFTFVTTASAVVREGAKPVFVDIDEATFNVDPDAIEASITPRTRAIVVVHYAGQACAMDRIMQIAEHHGIPVVEDAAQCIGASYGNVPLGTIGRIGCFSFHVTKNIVAGEAGAFVTNDDEMAQKAEIIREKGTNRSKFLRGEVDKYTWVGLGSSFVPSDLLAALLLSQLDRLAEITDRRRQLWQRYHDQLEDLERMGKIIRPFVHPDAQINGHIYALRLSDDFDQQTILQELKNRGVGATFHFVPLHSSPYAQERWGYRAEDLPVTEHVARTLVRLPLYSELTDGDQDYVVQSLHEVLADSASRGRETTTSVTTESSPWLDQTAASDA